MAVAMMAIILAGILPAYMRYSQINTDREFRTLAAAVAQQEMERLRRQEFSQWPGPSENVWTVSMAGRTFEVTVDHAAYTGPLSGEVSGAREVELTVRHSGRIMYEVGTVYTLFQ